MLCSTDTPNLQRNLAQILCVSPNNLKTIACCLETEQHKNRRESKQDKYLRRNKYWYQCLYCSLLWLIQKCTKDCARPYSYVIMFTSVTHPKVYQRLRAAIFLRHYVHFCDSSKSVRKIARGHILTSLCSLLWLIQKCIKDCARPYSYVIMFTSVTHPKVYQRLRAAIFLRHYVHFYDSPKSVSKIAQGHILSSHIQDDRCWRTVCSHRSFAVNHPKRWSKFNHATTPWHATKKRWSEMYSPLIVKNVLQHKDGDQKCILRL